uniref:thiamine-phosphate kinase n=1 Tax=Kribbia dieselivorans TaxID=331526 RepID=UPI000B29402D
MAPTLHDLGEDAVLARILPLYAGDRVDRVGPGDDAAVIATSGSVVATTDTMVRGRDWLDEWSNPADVAHKAFAQNVADIASMGARPLSLLISLAADPLTDVAWAEEFARGLGEVCTAHDVTVAGGDLSSAPPEVIVLSVTALGDLDGRPPVLRSG